MRSLKGKKTHSHEQWKYSQQRQTMKCNQHKDSFFSLHLKTKIALQFLIWKFKTNWKKIKLVMWIINLPLKTNPHEYFDVIFFCHSLWRNVNCFDLCTLRCVNRLCMCLTKWYSPWHFHCSIWLSNRFEFATIVPNNVGYFWFNKIATLSTLGNLNESFVKLNTNSFVYLYWSVYVFIWIYDWYIILKKSSYKK